MCDGTVEKRFKIRHVPTGEFSTGGMMPRKSSKGKIWKALGHILTHLDVFINGRRPEWYKDCVVEEYELTIKKVSEKPLSEMMLLKSERDAAKRLAIQKLSDADRKARELEELERLKKKYES